MAIIIILMRKTINIISLNSHLKRLIYSKIGASQVEGVVKNPPATAGDIRDRDAGLMSGPRRSPGKGHGDLLQYSCLENPQGQRNFSIELRFVLQSPRLLVLGNSAQHLGRVGGPFSPLME